MLHTIQTKQFIKSDITTVWEFISSPNNLSKITPKHMGFIVLSDLKNNKMYPGQIIEYYVKPFSGVKIHWVTEITHVKDNAYFVDEQRFGPYAFWHHQHFIKEVVGGVEMMDIVHYKVGFGIFGKLINYLVIKNKLAAIFDFRYRTIDELFNK